MHRATHPQTIEICGIRNASADNLMRKLAVLLIPWQFTQRLEMILDMPLRRVGKFPQLGIARCPRRFDQLIESIEIPPVLGAFANPFQPR